MDRLEKLQRIGETLVKETPKPCLADPDAFRAVKQLYIAVADLTDIVRELVRESEDRAMYESEHNERD